ncbi:MAG: hypothetical protein ACOYJB_00820 [Christensenellaceae bacterium]|jgi:flagellin-like hook-associated protein FlgL
MKVENTHSQTAATSSSNFRIDSNPSVSSVRIPGNTPIQSENSEDSLQVAAKIAAGVRTANDTIRHDNASPSLPQVAEGAFREARQALSQMHALAAQSVLDSATDTERSALGQQFEALKQKLGSIAEAAASFIPQHGQNIRTQETAGITIDTAKSPAPANVQSEIKEVSSSPVQFTVDLGDYAISDAQSGERFFLSIGDSGASVSLQNGTNTTESLAQALNEAIGALPGGTISLGGYSFDVQVSGDTGLQFTYAGESGSLSASAYADMQAIIQNASVNGYYMSSDGIAPTAGRQSGNIGNIVSSFNTPAPVVNTLTFRSSLKVGDIFRMYGKQFELVLPGRPPSAAGVSTISVFAAAGNQDILSAMKNAIAVQFKNTFEVSTPAQNQLQIAQKTPGTGDVSFEMQPADNTVTTVQLRPSKLKVGDQITLHTNSSQGNESVSTYIHAKGNGMDEIAGSLLQNTGGIRQDNTLVFENADVSVDFSPLSGSAPQAVNAQDAKMLAVFRSMDAEGLGLNGASVSEKSAAGKAFNSTNSALAAVSRMSSSLKDETPSLQERVKAVASTAPAYDASVAQDLLNITSQQIRQSAPAAMVAQANAGVANALYLLR